MIRVIFLILIIFSTLFVGAWLTAPFVFIYAIRWRALELLPLAVLVDSYFGSVVVWPVFTVSAFLMIVFAELTRKYLKFA